MKNLFYYTLGAIFGVISQNKPDDLTLASVLGVLCFIMLGVAVFVIWTLHEAKKANDL